MTLRKFTIYALAFLLIVGATSSVLAAPTFTPPAPIVTGTPLTLDKIFNLVTDIVNFLLGIALVIGIGYIAYGAILWITSATDTKAVEGAKNTIKAAFIGIAIVLGFGILVNTIQEVIQSQSFNSGGNFAGRCYITSDCPSGYYCVSGVCTR